MSTLMGILAHIIRTVNHREAIVREREMDWEEGIKGVRCHSMLKIEEAGSKRKGLESQ